MSLADAKCSTLTPLALNTPSLGLTASGTAPICGRATLAAGTTGAIATTAVGAQSIVIAFPEGTGANDGFLHYTVVAGTSITIVSSDNADARDVNWLIINPL